MPARTAWRAGRDELSVLERVKGIEPSYEAWEAAVLPLNYTRVTLAIVACAPRHSRGAPMHETPRDCQRIGALQRETAP